MPQWNPKRHPSAYPQAWHDLLGLGPGQYWLQSDVSVSERKALERKFSAFRTSLRNHPGTKAGKDFAQRTLRLASYRGRSADHWDVFVIVAWAPPPLDSLVK